MDLHKIVRLAILMAIIIVAWVAIRYVFFPILDMPVQGTPKDAICYSVDGSWYCYTSSRSMACEVIK